MEYRRSNRYPTKYIVPIKELLYKQSNGKFLTHDEKEILKKHAEATRKKRLK